MLSSETLKQIRHSRLLRIKLAKLVGREESTIWRWAHEGNLYNRMLDSTDTRELIAKHLKKPKSEL